MANSPRCKRSPPSETVFATPYRTDQMQYPAPTKIQGRQPPAETHPFGGESDVVSR